MARATGRGTISDLAGQPTPMAGLVDLVRLEMVRSARRPDVGDPRRRATCGASGRRSSPLAGADVTGSIAKRANGFLRSVVDPARPDAIVAGTRIIVDSAPGWSA